jgi:hypothetical protein
MPAAMVWSESFLEVHIKIQQIFMQDEKESFPRGKTLEEKLQSRSSGEKKTAMIVDGNIVLGKSKKINIRRRRRRGRRGKRRKKEGRKEEISLERAGLSLRNIKDKPYMTRVRKKGGISIVVQLWPVVCVCGYVCVCYAVCTRWCAREGGTGEKADT